MPDGDLSPESGSAIATILLVTDLTDDSEVT
jgi:hypothetical protein